MAKSSQPKTSTWTPGPDKPSGSKKRGRRLNRTAEDTQGALKLRAAQLPQGYGMGWNGNAGAAGKSDGLGLILAAIERLEKKLDALQHAMAHADEQQTRKNALEMAICSPDTQTQTKDKSSDSASPAPSPLATSLPPSKFLALECEIPSSQATAELRARVYASEKDDDPTPELPPRVSLLPQLVDAGEALGYRVTPHQELLYGGTVSLDLQSDALKVAIYIPATDDVAAEAQEIGRVLRSGYAYVLICFEKKGFLRQLTTHLKNTNEKSMPRLRFGDPPTIRETLRQLTTSYGTPESWTASTGKRFNVAFTPRHRAHPILAQALKQTVKAIIYREDHHV